jgi:hypothetical protein
VPPTWRALQNLGEFHHTAKRGGVVLLLEGWVAEWDEQVQEGEAGQRNGEEDGHAA